MSQLYRVVISQNVRAGSPEEAADVVLSSRLDPAGILSVVEPHDHRGMVTDLETVRPLTGSVVHRRTVAGLDATVAEYPQGADR